MLTASPSSLATDITRRILDKRVAVFCGAGISSNSGLPMGDGLKNALLGKLPRYPSTQTDFGSRLPLEVVLDTFSNHTTITPLLRIFAMGNPNRNHFLIGGLMSKALLQTVGTTNFDCNIERACPVKPHILADERSFHRISKHSGPVLLHLHGSVANVATIRANLREIAQSRLLPNREMAIRYLFDSGPHEMVLVMGYSMRDYFDINPAIRRIHGTKKDVVFVRHKTDLAIQDAFTSAAPSQFEGLGSRGVSITVDTDSFVETLWRNLEAQIGPPPPLPPRSTIPWVDSVGEWSQKVPHYARLMITGNLLSILSEHALAKRCHLAALEEAKSAESKALSLTSVSTDWLGIAHVPSEEKIWQYRRVLLFADRALEIISRTRPTGSREAALSLAEAMRSKGDALGHLGFFESQRGRDSESNKLYRDGRQLLRRAAADFRRLREPASMVPCYMELGVSYGQQAILEKRRFRRKQLKARAANWLRRCVRLAQSSGQPALGARSVLNLAILHRRLYEKRGEEEDRQIAIGYYLDCMPRFDELGDLARVKKCENALRRLQGPSLTPK